MKNYQQNLAILLLIFLLAYSCTKDKNNPSSPGPVPPDTNLVAYYAFDGNAIDSSMYHHYGIVSNAVPTTDRFEASKPQTSVQAQLALIPTLLNIFIFTNLLPIFS